ncbi:hypothetical protein H6G33_10030 [Calothrix sp. FACHB-1219]|uniref:hypothetical protein n=1 Tax=unclassified Calothrix TaxID=2619626 RepID=UPI001681EC83|nr:MULTISPECIES: hypothetical protein [unclassified Calothrix]MBD2201685.1 hypothetical protein [Calothrix sp. FACHB-168]MBD2217371.1 hypothetical protein [Calothrix sp. FACHB-1219]
MTITKQELLEAINTIAFNMESFLSSNKDSYKITEKINLIRSYQLDSVVYDSQPKCEQIAYVDEDFISLGGKKIIKLLANRFTIDEYILRVEPGTNKFLLVEEDNFSGVLPTFIESRLVRYLWGELIPKPLIENKEREEFLKLVSDYINDSKLLFKLELPNLISERELDKRPEYSLLIKGENIYSFLEEKKEYNETYLNRKESLVTSRKIVTKWFEKIYSNIFILEWYGTKYGQKKGQLVFNLENFTYNQVRIAFNSNPPS